MAKLCQEKTPLYEQSFHKLKIAAAEHLNWDSYANFIQSDGASSS